MKDYNMNTTVAGNTKGGGMTKQMNQSNPQGTPMAKVKSPDKYLGYKGKGGAANGRNVGKGC